MLVCWVTEPAIAYLANLNMDDVHEKEIKLNRIMSDGIKDVPGVEIIGPEDARQRSGICSVLLDDLPVHDIALLLDEAQESCVEVETIVFTLGLTIEVTRMDL